jgi:tetratricopeptide (TPR) repeat protein
LQQARRKYLNKNIEQRKLSNLSKKFFAVSIGSVLLHFLFLFIFPHIFNVPQIFERTWGFHFVTYFPFPVIAIFYALALSVCVPFFANLLVESTSQWVTRDFRKLLASRKEIIFILIALGTIPLFWLCNAKYGLLGDNLLRVGNVVDNKILPDERGSILILHSVYKLLHGYFYIDGLGSLIIFSNLCGGVFIYLSLRIADKLGRSFFEKVIIFLSYISFATIQHFCGYIEVYGCTVMMLTGYLYTSIRCIKGKVHLIVPVLCLVLAVWCHLVSLMFVPSIFWVIYEARLKRYAFFRKPVVWMVLLLGCAALAYLPTQKYVFPRLHPLIFQNDGRATMFSLVHIWEFLNGQLLACGPALIVVIGCLVYAMRRKARLTPELWFLFVSAGCVCASIFALDEMLGSSDWDICSYASLSLNLLAPYLFFHLFGAKENRAFARYAGAVFTGLMVLHTVPWIYINATDKSVRRFEDTIISDPGSYFIRHAASMHIGITLEANGLHEEAFRFYKQAYEADTDNEIHSYNYFVTLCKEKKTGYASPILLKIAQEHPAAFIYRFHQILRDAQASGDEALTSMVLQKLFELYRGNQNVLAQFFSKMLLTEYFREYFELLLKRDTPIEAEQVCKIILMMDPEEGVNHYNLARVYFKKGEYDSVITICAMLNKTFPGMPLPNMLGAQAFQRKQEAALAPRLNASEHDNDKNSDVQNNLGVASADQGRIEDAIGHYKEALRLNPENDKVYFNLGNVLSQQGRLDEAIDKYKEALHINPAFADAHNNLGNTLAREGHIDEAIKHFNEALRIKPYLADAQRNLDHAERIRHSPAK